MKGKECSFWKRTWEPFFGYTPDDLQIKYNSEKYERVTALDIRHRNETPLANTLTVPRSRCFINIYQHNVLSLGQFLIQSKVDCQHS